MLNELGINQHHDAVTGTGRQDVADDYAFRLWRGMKQNNEVYGDLINDKVKAFSGFTAGDDWVVCAKTNATYLDCPVSSLTQSTWTMNVAVHNPSSVDTTWSKIAVPAGEYSAESFNVETQKFEKAKDAALTCYADTNEKKEPVTSCFLNVEHSTAARDISLMKIMRTGDNGPQFVDAKLGSKLESKDISLQYAGFSTGESLIQFEYHNKVTNQTELLTLSLANWRSWKAYNLWTEGDGQPSGDYIFRPATNQFKPDSYSNYTMNATWMNNSSPSDQMTFYFENENSQRTHITAEERVLIHVSIDPDLQVIKVDVDMDSLPPVRLDGYEVIVDFTVENFNNNGTFYTDSNGLEMQKRILNYRPTWDLELNYNASLENVTANYFPVNSAVSMRDGDRVFTAMNGRSQAASALHDGGIQFMQNRRIPSDDHRGMSEWLDEKDQYGNGIRVPATYYLDITLASQRPNLQRIVQHK